MIFSVTLLYESYSYFFLFYIFFFNIFSQDIPNGSTYLVDSAIVLFNESVKYYKSGDYHKRLEVDIKLADIISKIYGEDSEDYLQILGGISLDYRMLGDYYNTLRVDSQILHILFS